MPTAKKTAAKKTPTAKKAATKKAPAGTMPKVSPLRGMDVDEWVKKKASGWQLALVEELVRVARKAAPKATYAVKWGIPVLDANGPVAFIKLAKAHVTFGFWRGAELADTAGLLEGGDRMRHLKISEKDKVPVAALSAFVKEAARLNAEKGDPTRRG
jgi:hypothetical protein